MYAYPIQHTLRENLQQTTNTAYQRLWHDPSPSGSKSVNAPRLKSSMCTVDICKDILRSIDDYAKKSVTEDACRLRYENPIEMKEKYSLVHHTQIITDIKATACSRCSYLLIWHVMRGQAGKYTEEERSLSYVDAQAVLDGPASDGDFVGRASAILNICETRPWQTPPVSR